MREAINRLVHFRNANHETWFYFSMIIFIGCVSALFLFKASEQFFCMASCHLGTSARAVYEVRKKKESEVYSTDCIWFNGLLCAIYAGLFYITKLN